MCIELELFNICSCMIKLGTKSSCKSAMIYNLYNDADGNHFCSCVLFTTSNFYCISLQSATWDDPASNKSELQISNAERVIVKK